MGEDNPVQTNQEQIDFWNDQAGEKWVQMQDSLDTMLEPMGRAVMEALGLGAGDRVVDVGCGCGTTSLAIARAVSPGGNVLGVDISEPMLKRARGTAANAGIDNAAFQVADVQTFAFDQGAFQAVFSRFGIMFFEDPAAAFRNLHSALGEAGRIGFACWQAPDKNPWILIPTIAAMEHLTIEAPSDPHAPGPFAFADADRVGALLKTAGFTDIKVEPLTPKLEIKGTSVAEVTRFVMDLGPTARALAEADDEELRERVAVSIEKALTPYYGEGAVEMDSAAWLITAVVA